MEEHLMIQAALAEGFHASSVVDTEKIVFNPAFRPFCRENLCGQYGANYTCPPDCGSPEQMRQRILAHRKALVLESLWTVDLKDGKALRAAKHAHNQGQLRLLKQFRKEGCDGFLVGASGCDLCSPCGCRKGETCRYPDLRWSCMSAYCIYVKALTQQCGMEYTPGKGKISFYGMFVWD